MNEAFLKRLRSDISAVRDQGLYKSERVIASPQGGVVRTGEHDVINLCANNYLGLANNPEIREAAHAALDRYGYGMASVRFICGTQTIHKQLEERLSALPRHGRHDPVFVLLRCQRRPLRDAAR